MWETNWSRFSRLQEVVLVFGPWKGEDVRVEGPNVVFLEFSIV
jgi:hypothetical protein